LTEGAAWTTGDFATVALTRGVGIARELLQAQAGCITLFVAALGIASDCLQFRILGCVLGCQFSRFSSRWIKATLAMLRLSS